MKRHFSHPPSQEEPSTKQARNGNAHVVSFDFIDESNKSLRTPLKATAMKSAKIASPSPRKLSCKRTAQKTAQSPEWSPASPIQKPCVSSPRRRRGGELSKEFKVRLNKICIFISKFCFILIIGHLTDKLMGLGLILVIMALLFTCSVFLSCDKHQLLHITKKNTFIVVALFNS